MIHIKQQISLEPFKSRLPGIIPAVMNNVDYFFDKISILKRDKQFTSNYGMCPYSIILPQKIALKIHNKFSENWEYEQKGDLIVSYRRLVSWYHFFETYYHLLRDYGSCGKVYKNAVEYYEFESNAQVNTNLYFGSNRSVYEKMDKKFKDLGGKTQYVSEDDCTSEIVDLFDVGLYGWMIDSCIPRFDIDKRLRDAWNCNYLYLPDAIKWVGWFTQMNTKYGKLKDSSKCIKTDNCCECEKFFNLGGTKMLKQLKDFVKRVEEIAEKWKQNTGEYRYVKNATTINNQIHIQNSVDDIGELSPLDDGWEGGVDYSNQLNNDIGTIVNYNDNVYVIKSKTEIKKTKINEKSNVAKKRKQYGYKFDERFQEFIFGNENAEYFKNGKYEEDNDKHWKDYTDLYIKNHPEEFNPMSETFSFNENGDMVNLTGNKTKDNEIISTKCEITKNGNLGFIVIDSEPIPIFEQEYIVYNNYKNPYLDGKNFLVYRYPVTNVPYVTIGKTTHISKNRKTFPFSDEIKKGNFILYKSVVYPVKDTVTIKKDRYDFIYYKVDGYFTYNGKTYFVKDSVVVEDVQETDKTQNIIRNSLNKVEEDWNYCPVSKEDNIIKIFQNNYTVYNARYINGKTESKLQDLKMAERTYDDLGNPLNGYYNYDNTKQKYAQPPEGELLEPLYQVGTTKNIYPLFENGEEKYFYGDIITEMHFYSIDRDGNKVSSTEKNIIWNIEMQKAKKDRITSLKAFNCSCEEQQKLIDDYDAKYNAKLKADEFPNVGTYPTFEGGVKCDITYYLGATLKYINGKGYQLVDGFNKGIEYKETVTFKKIPEKFFLKENDFYMVNVLIPEQEIKTIYSNTYNHQYDEKIASFKMKIFNYNDDEFSPSKGFSKNNNMIVTPTIRQEYKFGSAARQSVDSDIYIDRGINSAFEKHLKLGEISNMEDLTQYSNGFFKIMRV